MSVGDLLLPPTLQLRLASLPQGLQAHIDRVRAIARVLAGAHGIDEDLAELTAAAHDVARHISGEQLIAEAERIGIAVNSVERAVPILLHGPVGAAWVIEDASISDPGVLEGVRWHTTAHPDLAPVGQVVFIADKLDPQKAKAYPFQAEVRDAAFRNLQEVALTFLDGMMRQHVDQGHMLHPLCTETRNALLLAAIEC